MNNGNATEIPRYPEVIWPDYKNRTELNETLNANATVNANATIV